MLLQEFRGVEEYVKKEFLCECFDFPIMEESMIFECGASVDFEA